MTRGLKWYTRCYFLVTVAIPEKNAVLVFFESRPALFSPRLDGLLIALAGLFDRFLLAVFDGAQETTTWAG